MQIIIPFLILFISYSLIDALSDNCHHYANKAVDQYKLAKKNNLPNINWPLWTDDWNGHLNWCYSVSHKVAKKETAKRQAYLDKYITNNKGIQMGKAISNVQNDMTNNQPEVEMTNRYPVEKSNIDLKDFKLFP